MEPSLSEAYQKALAARSSGQRSIRIEVVPSRRFGQRFVRLWDSVVGKVVGRRTARRIEHDGTEVWIVEALVIEVNAVDVTEAMRRHVLREEYAAKEPPRAMRGTTRSRVSTNR